MSMIAKIKHDREEGTPGKWVVGGMFNTLVEWANGKTARALSRNWLFASADARRIARVPEMEAALLAADDLANALTDMKLVSVRGGDPDRLAAALLSYRKATK